MKYLDGSPQYCVVTPWQAHYRDPIVLRAGDPIWLSGKSDDWDGFTWVWARARDGKEGWIPDIAVVSVEGRDIAAFDFNALELSCDRSEVLTGLSECHGWILCQSATATATAGVGWVPARHLDRVAGDDDLI